MSRRATREKIFKLLFRLEFNKKDEMPEQLSLFFEDGENSSNEKDETYIIDKLEKILVNIDEIDKLIDDKAEGWKSTRMGKVDLTIIRLAIFEINFDDDIPTGVAINEAVELAKEFGQDESASFVNGVLAKFAKK
ncbi:MAG TPA: transcription antitermination factor NusB [Lachnospiraceae bacterium]|nr:transcription antitermination factor NusB [Lachnospiraceae bacterium]